MSITSEQANPNERPIHSVLLAMVLDCGIGDDLWKSFKYGGRPKVGKLFVRFRPKEKTAQEDFLFAELILIGASLACRSLYRNLPMELSRKVVARLMQLLIDGYPDLATWRLMHFPSRDGAAKFFHDGLLRYLGKNVQDGASVFIDRFTSLCGPINPRFLVGSAYMFAGPIPRLLGLFDEAVKDNDSSVDLGSESDEWVSYVEAIDATLKRHAS